MLGSMTRGGTARLALACLPLYLGLSWPAVAGEAGGDARAPAIREEPVAPGVIPVVRPAPLAKLAVAARAGAIGDAGLAELRGGTETPWSDMRLNGTVGNNAATNVATGSNIITDGAFSNASGLPMVIQNSGANVLIQNATIINVQFQ